MDEDSDKEASCVRENEIIGEIFSSNMSLVKKEILNYYDNEFESTPFSVQKNRERLLNDESQSRHILPSCSGLINSENSQNMLLNCNKIILGSKPNRLSSDGDKFEKSAKGYQEKNEVSIDENYFEELVTSYEPSVVLQDIQSYLHKSKRFCDYCSILFPESKSYESHVQIFHSENRSTGMSNKESLTERRQHECTICAKKFVAPHVLRTHLMNIHKLDSSNAIEYATKATCAKRMKETNGIENITKEVNPNVIEYATKITNTKVIENTVKEAYATIFENTAKEISPIIIENSTKETKTPKINHESSDLSNTCFHCRKAFHTQKSLIEHLYDILQMKRKNTEIVPVLKSVLFKCHKCDIHFTSSQLAANHAEHMEMLINWKCTICNRIFKKEDELSHERQHSVSNNYLIYNLGDLDVANILFRCSKCAAHFTESNFLYHFRDCGLTVTKTVTCKICNILLDYNLKTLHEFDKHTESKPFTIIQCDVISDNPVKSIVNKSQTRDKLKKLLKSFREVKVVLQKIDSNKINRNTKSGTVILSSKSDSQSIADFNSLGVASHEPPKGLQGNEGSGKLWRTRLRKSTSRKYKLLQGLNKNTRAELTDHSVLRRRNVTYSYCRTCKCFITKFRRAAHYQGRCKKLAVMACTCEHCGLVLNKASIMTHRRLHMEKKDLNLANFRFFNLINGRSMNPPIPEYPKCTRCAVHFLTKTATNNHICSEVAYHTCHLCDIKLSEEAFKLHMTFHEYATDRLKRATMMNSQSAKSLNYGKCFTAENVTNTMENNTELTYEVDVAETTQTKNTNREFTINDKTKLDALQVGHRERHVSIAQHLALRRRNLTYFYCETCKCFVTKFKKAAHVQGRCKKLAKIVCTCEYCGLIFNSASIVTHRRLHMEKKDLKLRNFRFFSLYTGRSMNPPIPEYSKCTQCAVHFPTKTARNNHICSEEAFQTCNLCEIKLSEAAFKFHMTFHQYAADRKKIAMSKNLQAATTLNEINRVADEHFYDTSENENVLPNNLPIVAETKLTAITKRSNLRRKYEVKGLNAFQSVNNKRPANIADLRRRNVTYFYCETCKCFVTKFKKAAHVQGRCKKLAKKVCTCEYCGLIFNRASIVTHRRLHMEKRDLKLRNFRFFSLYTGRSMNPPIPEYSKCTQCAVHFPTKTARNNHICCEEAFQTCNMCEIKLSEAAFKFHVTFHQYAADRNKIAMSKNLQAATTLNEVNRVADEHVTDEHVTDTSNNEIVLPNNLPIEAETKLMQAATTLNEVNRVADEHVTDTSKNEIVLPNNLPIEAETKLTAIRKRRNLCRKYEAKGLNAFLSVNKKRPANIADLRRRNLTYFYCETCKCFVTKFKKAAHVQGRCKKLAKIACTCEYCGLIFNSASIVTHRRLHMEKRDLKLRNFRFFSLYTGRSMNPPIPGYPKCDNCAVHYLTEKARTDHICSAEAHQTCLICEIKLSDTAFKLHMTFHDYASDRINRVTSKNSHSTTTLDKENRISSENATNSTESYIETIHNPLDVAETKLTGDMSQELNIKDKTKLDASVVDNTKSPVDIADHMASRRRNMTYSYCESCKCFITQFDKTAHVQETCKKSANIACTCEHCGLILNDASILTHKRLHEETKNLKLKDFSFFDLYTGRSMNPPIPEYPKCNHCAVHFLTIKAKNNHNCSQQAYQACRHCEMKLSQAAFKLHMMFHQYATDSNNATDCNNVTELNNTATSKNSQSVTTMDIKKSVTIENVSNSTEKYIVSIHNPPDVVTTENVSNSTEKYIESIHNPPDVVTTENVSNSTEKHIESIHNPPDVAEAKLTAKTNHEKMHDKIEMDVLQVVNKKTPATIVDHLSLRRRNVTYSYCETCKCFVTKFKKVAHVQGRCKKLAKIACTCEHCGLIFNGASIATHRRLHEEKKHLKLKHFRFFHLYTGRSMNPPIPEYPKCTRCSVQFLTKTARNNHVCSEQSYQMCHVCETKLSEAAFKLHVKFHQYPNDSSKGATTMNSQSVTTLDNEERPTDDNVTTIENDFELTDNPLDVAKTRLTAIKKCMNTTRKYNMNNRRQLNAFQSVNKKRFANVADHLALGRRNVTYSFCETCKCFITNFKKDVHVQGRCKNMAITACTCEHCGLILNSASIVTHKRLHEEIKHLKLNNFRFFDLYTGRSMNPPVPEYPKCNNCAVHFLTKTARKDHVCSKEAYQTCHLCEMKLSEAAFKLHMTFHQYATKRINKVTLKNSPSALKIDIDKRITKEDISKTTENETELIRNTLDATETLIQNSSEIYEIIYTCGNCSVSVDTYDKLVEHCQGHYENEDQVTQTKVCDHCELTIDATCYTDHHNLHEKGKQFKLLKFDSYYLPADNNMWVKHIFKTLPHDKVLDILKSSIYRFECRIKMDVIQQGDPNLTVYRCDQCCCFIEPSSLFKHSDNSCFKLRHHPCTVCGIPFNSSASRVDHEKVHSRPGITKDSYRIVVFNRERDKQVNRSFCLRKNYVLYQCRNCGVIIDKLQRDVHKCDVSNVKKCSQCALLLHSEDFEKHVNTHKEFVSFNYSNMKIIIHGEGNSPQDRNENTLRSNFKGAIYDYKMYICNRCEICVKNEMCISDHICRYGKQRLKCLKCDLYFSVGRLKTHTRSHEHDPDFVRSNMNIVSFDPCTLDQNKNTTVVCSKDCELSDSNTDSDAEILAANDTSIADVETNGMTPEILEEETVKLYKCTCELHFLNEDSIIRHFGVCRSKATIFKQKCPKCDLLFTPNVLFTHLLAHHSKNNYYKYNVIEMDNTQKNM